MPPNVQEERDVTKIVVGFAVFLFFSAFPILVAIAHFLKSSEDSRKSQTTAAEEDKFWNPPKLNAPSPGKRIMTPEQKIKEANDFYFLESPKELDIKLPPLYDSNAPAPTTPEYELDRDFMFLAIQILRNQSILGLSLSKFREPGSAKNKIFLKELASAADACGFISSTVEKITGKILRKEENAVSDEMYKRAYVLNRLTSHPVARNLVTAFAPAAALQTVDPTNHLNPNGIKKPPEYYNQVCDKAMMDIPPEAHQVLIQYSGFTTLKEKKGEEGVDPENRILVFNPDATAMILWDVVKESFEAGDENTAEERVVELFEVLSLLPEGPFVEEWLSLLADYSHKMDNNLIHYQALLAYNYVNVELYDAAKKVLDKRINSGKAIKNLYPIVHPLITANSYNKPKEPRVPVKNLRNFDVLWSLIVDRKSRKVQKKDFFGAEASIEKLRPHFCREVRHILEHIPEFIPCALEGKKILQDPPIDPKDKRKNLKDIRLFNNFGLFPALYEYALAPCFVKKDEFYQPTTFTDPRTMAAMAVFQRQIIVFKYCCLVPLDPNFLYNPLDMSAFKNAYQVSNKGGSMDVPMRLYDGTMFGEADQGVYSDLLVDPRGVALTEKALKMCIEQRVKAGIAAYRAYMQASMIDPSKDSQSWYTSTFEVDPEKQDIILRLLKYNIFLGQDPMPEKLKEEKGNTKRNGGKRG